MHPWNRSIHRLSSTTTGCAKNARAGTSAAIQRYSATAAATALVEPSANTEISAQAPPTPNHEEYDLYPKRNVVSSSEQMLSRSSHMTSSVLDTLHLSILDSLPPRKRPPLESMLPVVAPTMTTLEDSPAYKMSPTANNPPPAKKKAMPSKNAMAPSSAPTKKKKKKKKKKVEGQDGAAEANTPLLAASPRTRDMLAKSWLATRGSLSKEFTSGWGEDKLTPPTATDDSKSELPPHMARHMPRYSRRVEGLLEPKTEPALEDVAPVSEHRPIARLAHGLERVLFNPGVHWLQDPRSHVYNFHPHLERIPKVTDFAFERLEGFVKSSRDEDLWELAKRENRSYAGSTSSLSGMLSHIYFLISQDKEVDTSVLSQHFRNESKMFTSGQRMPSSVLLNHKDGIFAVDSYKPGDSADKNILTWMGTLLEKYLTMTPEEFATYQRSASVTEGEEDERREAFRFAKSKKFVMRSQLDCQDERLPGTGVFDIKTRACIPIRLDILNYEENSGYLIRTQHGPMESFEREYYDLIRSAFLKYSFQVRIGNMDGVIVAYHNTEQMFGFQYISLEEMDERLFGKGKGIGEQVFEKCIGLLENVMDEVVQCFPNQSVRCIFETQIQTNKLNIWVQPDHWEGAEEERPIQQLEVTVTNYIGQDPIKGHRAVGNTDGPWTIHYAISQLSATPEEMRIALAGANDRAFRTYNLPSGLEIEDMEAFWAGLNFGGVQKKEDGAPDAVSPTPSSFQAAGGLVATLREIARQGREHTIAKRKARRGLPKVVLGQPDVPAEEFEEDLPVETAADLPVETAADLPVETAADLPVDVAGSVLAAINASSLDADSATRILQVIRRAGETTVAEENVLAQSVSDASSNVVNVSEPDIDSSSVTEHSRTTDNVEHAPLDTTISEEVSSAATPQSAALTNDAASEAAEVVENISDTSPILLDTLDEPEPSSDAHGTQEESSEKRESDGLSSGR